MERAMYIEKFRNIGLHKAERIVLNNSLEKGKIGNLVILIGANNSGKSNVLDALFEMGQGSFKYRDITTLSYEEKDKKISLSLCCKNGGEEWTQRITYNGTTEYFYPEKKIPANFTFAKDLNDLNESLNTISDFLAQRGSRNLQMRDAIERIKRVMENDPSKVTDIETQCVSLMKTIIRSYPKIWEEMKTELADVKLVSESIKFVEKTIDPKTGLYLSFKERYGYDFFPKIIRYTEEKIGNSNIKCTCESLQGNKFFVNILRKIGVSVEEVQNAYHAYKDTGNRGALTTLQNKLNDKVVAISDDFNRLYFIKNEKYTFKFTIETGAIFFEIRRGEYDQALDYQSTGFRWFFNLYFNLLCNNTLNPGDVLIMDEPATNLHVQGQRELRKFLKEFAIHNDIVIIIATHSPFLIDLDYLDEIRVVSNYGDVTSIANDFSTIDLDDPDSLKPIKSSLTVDNRIILDPDNTVVFVEGITDYNYLITMRNKLGIGNDIVFLPIKGIGNILSKDIKEKQKRISRELISIKKQNPILLVDSDNAGKSMQRINKENSALEVITLEDIDPKFRQIESLFSKADAERYNIAAKSSSASSLMKNYPDEYEFDDVTLANFRKVFDRFE